MAFTEAFIETPEYASHRMTGVGSFSEWRALALGGLARAIRGGHRRMLSHSLGVDLTVKPSTFERFQFGEQGAAAGGAAGVTLAFLAPESLLDSERFGITVAINRGLKVEAFTNEVDALHWLVGPNALRPVLETPRTRLRWLVPNDASFILELLNQPSWIKNIGDRGVRDLAGAEEYIRNGPVASYAKHRFGLWCVERKADGVPAGICGLLQREYLAAPDLGYAFLERFHGQGFASETTAATVAYARTALGIGRIHALVTPTNTASIRVLEKLGMRYLREMTEPGDSEVLSLYGTEDEGQLAPPPSAPQLS